MFQFTTTTIINKNEDPSTKKPLIVTEGDKVQIKRVANFDKASTVSVSKAAFEPATLSSVKLRVGSTVVPKNVYRVVLYIRLQDSQNSYYANDFVFKGKPLYVEAVAPSESGAALASEFIKNAKKYITMVYEKELVTMSNDSGTSSILTIEATDAHQLFTQAEVQHWIEPVVDNGETVGHWETIVLPKEGENIVGNPGFGTYEHLLHNYVLPTGANLRFGHILENEVPMVNGEYTQYIVTMRKSRGIMGGDAVGQPAESITTHVFWVASDVVAAFDEAMKAITDDPKFTNADKDVKTKAEQEKVSR